MRSIFKDEVLSAYEGSYTPRYRITTDASGASSLALLNPVAQSGTKLSAGIFNNMYDFDNLASQSGHRRETTFTQNVVTETLYANGTNEKAAERVTTFQPDGSILTVETIHGTDDAVRATSTTTSFQPGGKITEGVTQQ